MRPQLLITHVLAVCLAFNAWAQPTTKSESQLGATAKLRDIQNAIEAVSKWEIQIANINYRMRSIDDSTQRWTWWVERTDMSYLAIGIVSGLAAGFVAMPGDVGGSHPRAGLAVIGVGLAAEMLNYAVDRYGRHKISLNKSESEVMAKRLARLKEQLATAEARYHLVSEGP